MRAVEIVERVGKGVSAARDVHAFMFVALSSEISQIVGVNLGKGEGQQLVRETNLTHTFKSHTGLSLILKSHAGSESPTQIPG